MSDLSAEIDFTERGEHLLNACKDGDFYSVRLLLRSSDGTRVVNVQDEQSGITPAMVCCSSGGRPRTLKYILEAGAKVNIVRAQLKCHLYCFRFCRLPFSNVFAIS
jgi:hypothetical protein